MASYKSTLKFFMSILLISSSTALEKQLDDNYFLSYTISKEKKSIDLEITATNVAGWVALGINDAQINLPGSDWFIGGVDENDLEYGDDYHVPTKGENAGQITLDDRNRPSDWNLIEATVKDGNTKLHINRLLDTGDSLQDLPIHNKSLYLFWAYNNESDEIVFFNATGRGVIGINLFETGESGAAGMKTSFLGIGAILLTFFVTIFQN